MLYKIHGGASTSYNAVTFIICKLTAILLYISNPLYKPGIKK